MRRIVGVFVAVIFLVLFLAMVDSQIAFATADEDSERLSQSFNTIPLGRTNHGFVTVEDGKQDEFEVSEKVRLYACTQDQSQCLRQVDKKKTPVKKTGKKNTFDQVQESLLE